MTETEKGEIVKMEVDNSAACDEKIPVAEKFAEEGNLEGALEILHFQEEERAIIQAVGQPLRQTVRQRDLHRTSQRSQ